MGPVYLIQNCLQSFRKIIFQYIEHPKISFILFLIIPTKKANFHIDKHIFIESKNVKTGLKLAIFWRYLKYLGL
jgi:hypothetical protein